MLTIRTSFLFLFLLGASSSAFAADSTTIPGAPTWLAWDANSLSPGWIPGDIDHLPVAPSALIEHDGWLFIADDAHRRVLVIDPEGKARRSFETGMRAADIAIDGRGRIGLLSGTLDEVRIFDLEGGLLQTLSLSVSRVRALAVGPRGNFWVECVDGHAVPLHDQQMRSVAVPMGEGQRWHGVGRWVSPVYGEILLWGWGEKAEVKPPGPGRVIRVETEERLGSVRPIGMDGAGHVFVRVERISKTTPLQVWTEIRAYDVRGVLVGRVVWPENGVAPVSRAIRVSDDGTIFRKAPGHAGLALWRIAPSVWITGGAR